MIYFARRQTPADIVLLFFRSYPPPAFDNFVCFFSVQSVGSFKSFTSWFDPLSGLSSRWRRDPRSARFGCLVQSSRPSVACQVARAISVYLAEHDRGLFLSR